MYKKVVLKAGLISLLGSTLLYAEYGDYGYDNNPPKNVYQKPQPRRSISAKQVIIQNRKTIAALKGRVDDLEEKISGLTSLVEGINETIAEMKMQNAPSSQPAGGNGNTTLIKELGAMIDKINASYVSKEELQRVLDGKKISSIKPSLKKETGNTSFKGRSTSKIYSEGARLFVKQRYDEAEKRFKITDTKGYKPAASNYYLGEISYYTKKYEDAIFYYKKSASLYDQASYIDVLLLHTAISLEKTGDKAQAKTFYKSIIDNYPGKKSAKIAKKRLKKL